MVLVILIESYRPRFPEMSETTITITHHRHQAPGTNIRERGISHVYTHRDPMDRSKNEALMIMEMNFFGNKEICQSIFI